MAAPAAPAPRPQRPDPARPANPAAPPMVVVVVAVGGAQASSRPRPARRSGRRSPRPQHHDLKICRDGTAISCTALPGSSAFTQATRFLDVLRDLPLIEIGTRATKPASATLSIWSLTP